MSLAQRDHFLYRCYDGDGVLLYIGCTSNVAQRLAAHRSGSGMTASQWLSVSMTRVEVSPAYRGRDAGLRREARAIESEGPLFNTLHRDAPGWDALNDVARYLIDHGHLELARATACLCWIGQCVAHHRQEIAA